MARFNPVIKWSGSKRSQADAILNYAPDNFATYYEPFLGGGSMLYAFNPSNGVCGDICAPLISLWKMIKENPAELAEGYAKRWKRLQTEGYLVFYEIRDDFNKTQSPIDLMFLSRTCVNGLIRFNAKGEFNNSLHHTRPGIAPDRLERIINDWSKRIQTTEFYAEDYRVVTETAKKGDLVYLDPPYFHTKGRYYGGINYDEFLSFLDELNKRGVKYILSFDGVRGDSDYRVDFPKELYARQELIPSGNSSFKKVIDKEQQQVYESLYLNW